jgi:hypothetical protein
MKKLMIMAALAVAAGLLFSTASSTQAVPPFSAASGAVLVEEEIQVGEVARYFLAFRVQDRGESEDDMGRVTIDWPNTTTRYASTVICVNVIDDTTARFAFQSPWEPPNPWLVIEVVDGGTPGSMGDIIRAHSEFDTEDEALTRCEEPNPPETWDMDTEAGEEAVVKGNVVVRS